jgi:dihydropteroate synthase
MTWADLLPDLGTRTLVMGIVNLSPDSFSDGAERTPDQAVEFALELVDHGADILDVGGESTRPGSDPVPAERELERVIPVIEGIRSRSQVPISLDSAKPDVQTAGLAAGTSAINDVTGLQHPDMVELAARARVPVVIMHILGTPKTMQDNPSYRDVVAEVSGFLQERAAAAEAKGIAKDCIALDPGIGFGKTTQHNLQLLRNLSRLAAIGYPVLVGPSRKRFIGEVLDLPVGDREEGTAAAVALAVANGALIVRVHDVRRMARVAKMADAIVRGQA